MEKKYFFIEIYKSAILTVIAIFLVLAYIRTIPKSSVSDTLRESIQTVTGQDNYNYQPRPDLRRINSNRDAIIADLTALASMAQQYYRKPKVLGGGGYSFDGWNIPPQLWTNNNGNYNIESSTANSITLVGEGVETVDGTTKVKVSVTVAPDRIIGRKIIH